MVRVHVRPPPHPPSTAEFRPRRPSRRFQCRGIFHPPRRVSLATGRRPPILHRAAVGEDFFQRKQQTIRLAGPRLFMRGLPGHARGGAHSVAPAGRAVPRAPSNLASRLYGRMADALAVAGEEGRGKLR